uniref:Uncharacterized protein n=1 Tax=Panagrolaimus superbus TaxID=310955 RepID=A0A914YHY8_9BILA
MEYIYFVNGSSINFDSFADKEIVEDEPSSDVHPTLDEISKDLKNVEDYNSIVELDENVEVEEDFTVVIDFVGGNDEREFAIILEFVNEVTDDQIEDEEDYTFEFGVDDVEDQSHVVNPTVENRQIKRSRFIPMLRR